MKHPAELAVHQYMTSAVNGTSTMSEDTINQVANDIKDALHRQFGGERKEMTLGYVCQMLVDLPASYGMRRISLKLVFPYLQHL